jgi:hypothetical protein
MLNLILFSFFFPFSSFLSGIGPHDSKYTPGSSVTQLSSSNFNNGFFSPFILLVHVYKLLLFLSLHPLILLEAFSFP